jgi:hypothetical protein
VFAYQLLATMKEFAQLELDGVEATSAHILCHYSVIAISTPATLQEP